MFYQPKFFKDWLTIYKRDGFKQLIKKKGWSVLFAFFLFYLIRDSIIYILIPYLAFSKFNSCF
ncbi:MAG: hypothetical protein CMF95_00240 [Candidatus Marinimicrobia bacterium]|nr:hypothetical protein [Candidatus Neomarinimicrobiota bacterium]